ncbi:MULTISPECIES: HlyD family secretion protein [Providencia]|uniref:HlyD family secretion protein n=1 Tax=Providencia stuartii TaxID=588 RepID=A0AAI9I0W4_PROST|nr:MULTISPECIES: HlyD family secretion protein [Providencia]ELR5045805.1 HlyD family secretion protein [Providencia rettgeri]ELR5036298.1 HlyD family secretion protein [Providencia stuartii]ELR5122567.1 HlyD family secretion protein [Providencia stuartii]ELR5292862.1 HlyD family secretion protein [Providencia stuartii]ELZ5940488.1 HlyD family secretion protein [Providencia stuartii]
MATEETKKFSKKIFGLTPWISVLCIGILVAITTFNWNRWQSNQRYQESNNAYIKSDSAILKSRMTGYISRILVDDYQYVHQGEVIAEINNQEELLNQKIAKAKYIKAEQQFANLADEIKEHDLTIEKLLNRYKAAGIEVAQMQRSPLLRKELIKSGAITSQNHLDAQSDLQRLIKLEQAAKAEWEQAKQSKLVLMQQEKIRLAERDIALANYQQAETQISYSTIVAPFDGQLNKIKLNVGSLVTPGTEIVTVTPRSKPYIIAQLKETQLKNVQSGQSVSIAIDAFPGMEFRGVVRDIGAQSSGEAALIPADNSSGNFTKVVQRIPVYISFLSTQSNDIDKLRPGMSVVVNIDTQSMHSQGK